MVEQLEEQESQSFDLQQYLGIVRRRHLHFLLPMFLGWLLVWGASWILPARYKSGTLILVEQPTMPKDYVTPNVTDDLQERLQSITQQILSRTRLLHIIDELNLYGGQHGLGDPDQKVERMRKDIDIDLVRDAQNRVTAFNVYYSSRDPHIAQQVTSELTNLFINENLEIRQQQSEGTTKFLESQLETARQDLTTQEERIRDFKGQHLQELPSQQTSNLQILAGLQSQLHNEQDALGAAQQQHVYLQSLLTQYRSLQTPGTTSDGTQLGLPAIDQELDRLKAELTDLTSRYTERHPDVRKLKEQITKTEKTRSQLLADLKSKRNGSQADAGDTSAAQSSGNLAQATPLAQLQSQLQANEIESRNREQTVAALQQKINEYQGRLNQEPVREQQLADLTRGYEQSKNNYDDLLKKKNESAMATSMELLQQGERFRIIDPPSLPLKPDFPNRLKFCGIGVAAGLAFGALVVGAFEITDDRLYSEKEIKDLIPVPVILELPVIVNSADEKSAMRKMWLGWASAAFVLTLILVGSALSFLRG
jgi:polysaccharide chain length determinant protein (PEP-CTERM system associated)